MSTTIDFGELKNDAKFTNTVNQLEQSIAKIEQSLTTATMFNSYDELSVEEKVKLDNYMAYSINSLYWMYVKLHGMDPNEHGIQNEISRVRQTIMREKQIIELKTLRPVLDKEAAGRFIKHGLHVTRDKDEDDENQRRESR